MAIWDDVRDVNHVVAKFSHIGQYNIVLDHPLDTTIGENFAKDSQNIDLFYMESKQS
jgi:hypothetical protein